MALLPNPNPPTVEAIFAAYESDNGDGFRPHLGASLIGKECERALWLDFRWAVRSKFGGRMLRLFETGQQEENRLIRNLRRIGVTVLDVDPKTGRQWRVQACGGHFGGSLDAAAIGVIEAPKSWHQERSIIGDAWKVGHHGGSIGEETSGRKEPNRKHHVLTLDLLMH